MKRLFACTLMLIAAAPTLAVDANGYTAKYECRAGGQYCNVDVATLGNRTCEQTISTSTPWSSINWSNNTICLEAGDHTGKGTLTIPSSANGTAGNYKVLRYTRASDNDNEPWNQSSGNKATVRQIIVNSDYWIIHRLTFDGTSASYDPLLINGQYNIVNRILAENFEADWNEIVYFTSTGSNSTLQNSVVRNAVRFAGVSDLNCVKVDGSPSNVHIVNNEIYNCQGDGIQVGENDHPGTIIENNDIYTSTAFYSDGNGNLTPTGNYSCSENALDIKGGGTSANPLKIIHNRVWGHRWTDTHCADGSGGDEIIFHVGPSNTNTYGLIQNNVIFNGTYGVGSPNNDPNNWSITGNLFYDLTHSPYGSVAYVMGSTHHNEAYLNTFVGNTKWISFGGSNNDIMCNVAIDNGGSLGSPTNSFIDYTAFYGTGDTGETHKVANTLKLRTNSTAFSVGDIIRTGAASSCVNGTESACFLYKVTSGGTSASSAPSYCTTLGCTQTDGLVQVQAVHGPYSFRRKIRTISGGEVMVIPYARAHVSAPEAYSCSSAIGSRPGVGINDNQLF